MIEIGQSFSYYEAALELEKERAAEDTLFVQITPYEHTLIAFGLFLVGRFYGDEVIQEMRDKFIELIRAQAFCTCPKCVEEREEAE